MLSPKNSLQHIQLSDTTETSNGTGFYGQMKLINELFSSKHSRWVWRVGRGREPWEQSEAGGVNDNERHLRHSPVSSPTEELRKE